MKYAVALFLVMSLASAGCQPASRSRRSRDVDAGGWVMEDGGTDPIPDGGSPPVDGFTPPPLVDGSTPPPPVDGGGGPPPPASPPGSACSCDVECAGNAANPGVCVFGVCMTIASEACSAGGSTAECPAGSRCWGLSSEDVMLCWPDCDSFSCAGTCDSDGSCAPDDSTSCDSSCGSLCGGSTGPGPCSPSEPAGTCATADDVCVDGACVAACSPSHPSGYCAPGTTCTSGACRSTSGCPSWECTSGCTALIAMPGSHDRLSAQARADGYYIATEARYAFLRRDLTLVIRHAACQVAARYPGTQPIGLSDLSQADGLTPGTDVGGPRHPTSTHHGDDFDLAYYQTDGTNNPQIICGDGSDTNSNGYPGRYNDGYFCTTEANIIDWPREAYWFAMLASTPLVRVFGIDETLPDDFRRELGALLSAGAITRAQHDRASVLGYGADGGWPFHHHHSHMSYNRP